MSACPSCAAPVAPDARFCASCGSPLDQRCRSCGTVLPADSRFCPSCGTPTRTAPEVLSAEPGGEERKIVSVAFADLVGFTAAGDGADPEDIRRRLSPYHEAIRQEVERYGGRVEKLMGDGVLAVFGAPVVHEDDAERAVRAGLQIQERIAGMAGGSRLSARVAVGTGEVVVAIEGTTMDREGLVGDVVNTTSRLQSEAPPGTVLVDEATYRVTRRAFRYEERPPVVVRGKAEPLALWLALAPTGRFGVDIEDDGATLVGRDTELNLLIDTFSRSMRDATSQILTIAGEPGVGKSRLVRELRRHVDDLPDLIRWRQGRCLPYGEGMTYWAFGEIVKAEAGILETDPPGTAVGKLRVSLEPLLADHDELTWVAGRVAALVGSGEEVAAAEKSERFAAWHRYLGAFGEQRPTVLVVEDLHWADPNLVEFLADVPEATRGTPLLLVCTARPDFFESHPTWGARQRDSVTIRLDPLDADATSRLLDELLAEGDLDERTRRMVMDRCGGNPLWAQEFVRMLHDRTEETATLAIPDTVQAVVAARIDLLDPGTKTVAQAASTIGKSFWAGAVADLVDGSPGLGESLRELTRRELIRRERVSTVAGETEYAFTHSVVRDVAYGQAPRAARAARHHRVARWIERIAGERVADRAEVIAHHDAEALRLAAAADLPDVTRFTEAAIVSHRRAAAQAARLDASAQRGHLEAALELVPHGDQRRGGVLLDLGAAYAVIGMADMGIKALLEARDELDVAGDIEGWGMASVLLAQYSWVAGDPTEAERFTEEAVGRLEQHPPGPALAAAYARAAARLWLRGDATDEALELIDRVRPVVEVHGDTDARRRLLSADGGSRFDAGDPSAIEPFRQVLRMAIEADESGGIGTAYNNLGEELRTGWGVHEAISVHERGLEVAVQRRTVGVEQFLRLSVASDLFLAGRWDEAAAHLDVSLARPERLAYLEGEQRGQKLVIQACRGEAPGDAVFRIDRIVADAEGLADLQAIIPAYQAAMWTHFMAGDEAGAVGFARRIVERSGATRFLLDAWSLTVWLLERAGELDRIGSLLPALRRFDMPRPRALIAVVAAVLDEADDPAAAVETIERAAQELADLGVATDAVIALAAGVRIAEPLEDGARAKVLRERGRELLAAAGAEPFLERIGL